MKLQFKKINFKPNKYYDGEITNVVVDKERNNVYIFVTLDIYKDESFLKSIPFSKDINGQLARLLDDLMGLEEDGSFELDDLCEEQVRVTLSRGKNKKWFVDEMELISDEDTDEDMEDDDE